MADAAVEILPARPPRSTASAIIDSDVLAAAGRDRLVPLRRGDDPKLDIFLDKP